MNKATAANIFENALRTARRIKTSAAYREAALWAGESAMEAPYGGKEIFWAQQDECLAMVEMLLRRGS